MSELEPLEPTSIRHALDFGLARQGVAEFAHNHIDYRFGIQPNAVWARAYFATIDKVTVHDLEHHDSASDHVLRVLMYLGARFKEIEVFDAASAEGYRPLPQPLQARMRDALDDWFATHDLKIAGWDEPASSFKS